MSRLISTAAALFTVISSMPSHAAELHVPKDHGTIMAAVKAARSGDTVIVEMGVYREQIELKTGITLRSAGDDAKGKSYLKRAEETVIDLGGASKEPGVTMAARSVLDGFTVTGVGPYDDVLWKTHFESQGEKQSHEHIGHFGTPAVSINGVNCEVVNNIVHHNGDTGIAIRGKKSRRCAPYVAHNICYRNMGGGIGSMNGSTATIESNICFENFFAGIGHSGASPVVVDNECFGNVRAGIGVSEGAKPIVRGNRCYENRRAGIGIRTGGETRPLVEDNECFANEMAGIGTEEGAAPVIRSNRCYKNKLAGIGARHEAHPVIESNHCYENGMAGIGCTSGARPIIRENICERNKTAGIGVRGGAKAVVVENRCLENKLVALGLPEEASAIVIGNRLVRTGGMPPLVAVRGGATAVLMDNEIRGGGVAGVLVQGKLYASGNQFESPTPSGAAVSAAGGSDVVLKNNVFRSYRHALRADAARVSVVSNEFHNFRKVAIQLTNTREPVLIVGNTAHAADAEDRVIKEGNLTGVIHGNTTKTATRNGADATADTAPRNPVE